MDDLIYRQAAIDALSTPHGIIYPIRTIESLPSVDAVPVVRCKDCAYLDEVDEHELWCMGNGYPARLVTPDEYCSKGAPK